MNIKQPLQSLKFWLLKFIQVQLFLTLFSLPIMLVWGLPISLLSPLGNLLFSPVIALFLSLSSLIFFLELCSLPNAWFISLLTQLTNWWLTFMHAHNKGWLVGFIKPSWFFMAALIMAIFYAMHHQKTRTLYANIACLSIIFCITLASLKISAHYAHKVIKIPCHQGEIIACTHNNSLTIIDPGLLGTRLSAASWAQYTLMPTIIKKSGYTTIENLILLKPNGMTFQAAERLCITVGIKNIYLVCWQGLMTRAGLKNYHLLKKTAAKKGVTLHRIGKYQSVIAPDAPAPFYVEPLVGTLKTSMVTYPALAIRTQIDDEELTICCANYKAT